MLLSLDMASLTRSRKTKFYIACFTSADGRQLKRSTKTTDKIAALRIALELEQMHSQRQTEMQIRALLTDSNRIINNRDLFEVKPRKYFEDWLNRKRFEVIEHSLERYQSACNRFLTFLGPRAEGNIGSVCRDDIRGFRDLIASRFTPSTANIDVKILRHAFRTALSDNVIWVNPTAGVSILKDRAANDRGKRRPFTVEELNKLLAVMPPEWRRLTMLGMYSGQRLGDLARLTGTKLDPETGIMNFRSGKTGRQMIVPLPTHFVEELRKLRTPGPDEFWFPGFIQMLEESKGKKTYQLSNHFRKYLLKAGLLPKWPKDKNSGRGHSVQRRTAPLSFHSLRHFCTSYLKNQGVPEIVVRDIIGHESDLVSRAYSHVDVDMKRQALSAIPRVL